MNLYILSISFFLLDVGFSIYSPKSVCDQMQRFGIVSQCQSGTPWAFEVPQRTVAQYRFYPTNPEIFACYRISAGRYTGCQFEGAITQFATLSDLSAAVDHIKVNHHHVNTDPHADVVEANTTIENYIPYVFPSKCLLIMMPLTENGVAVQKQLEFLLGPSEVY